MNNERSFDTLQYANKLKAAGVPEKQAEIIDSKLATKLDLERVNSELKHDIKEMGLRIEAIKNELLIKLGGMIVGGLGALVILMKLFKL